VAAGEPGEGEGNIDGGKNGDIGGGKDGGIKGGIKKNIGERTDKKLLFKKKRIYYIIIF